MEKGREVGGNIFESRSKGFGDFGGFGFGRSMMPSLFGGWDPFDDPFFTNPFDSLFGRSSAPRTMHNTSKDKGVVIEELGSDDDGGTNFHDSHNQEGFGEPKIYRSTMEPSVEHPDDNANGERKNSNVTYKNDHYKAEPQKARNFSFQTSRVTYGGVDGAYYTSTRSRRTGADGAVIEERKEADTTTGEATHRISRGIRDKGHSLLRKLDSHGKVDTTQTLHNLEEDELGGFEKAWKGNNLGQYAGWKEGFDMNSNHGNHQWGEQNRNQIWATPYLEQAGDGGRGFASNYETGYNSSGRAKKVVRINIE